MIKQRTIFDVPVSLPDIDFPPMDGPIIASGFISYVPSTPRRKRDRRSGPHPARRSRHRRLDIIKYL